MESWLYPSKVEELLAGIGLGILDKSEPLHDATKTTLKYAKNIGNWRAYLCQAMP